MSAPVLLTREEPVLESPTATAHDSNFSIGLGARSMENSSAWGSLSRPLVFSVDADTRPEGALIGPEFGIGLAADVDGTLLLSDANSEFLEFYLGLRLTLDLGSAEHIHPYIGLGGTFLLVDARGSVAGVPVDAEDSTFGAYAHAGIYFDLTDAFRAGVDLRTVQGSDLDFGGVDLDADYVQALLTLGAGF